MPPSLRRALYRQVARQKLNTLQARRWLTANSCISQVAASLLAERLEGIGVDEARRLSADEAVQLLGIRLSPMRVKCALLAWRVLQRALPTPVESTTGGTSTPGATP